MGHKGVCLGVSYSDVIHHHLVKPAGPKRALNDIGNSLGSQHYSASAIFLSRIRAREGERTILITNIRPGNLLAAQEEGAVAGLLEHGSHGCFCEDDRTGDAVVGGQRCVGRVKVGCLPVLSTLELLPMVGALLRLACNVRLPLDFFAHFGGSDSSSPGHTAPRQPHISESRIVAH